MTKKASKLINENVIRRWGKLANMPALTENFIDTIAEEGEMEDEMVVADDEMAADDAGMESEEEAAPSTEETDAVESIVQAVVDAIAAETGVAIEVEGEAGEEAAMDDMDADMAASDEMEVEAGAEMADEEAAMRDMAYNRKDVNEEFGGKKDDRKSGGADKDASQESEDTADDEDPTSKKGKARREAALGEKLDLDVIDDEALTEAVLRRVVERLLKSKKA
jgi:hypothetical protein